MRVTSAFLFLVRDAALDPGSKENELELPVYTLMVFYGGTGV